MSTVSATGFEQQIHDVENAGEALSNQKQDAEKTLEDYAKELASVKEAITKLQDDIRAKIAEIAEAEDELVQAQIAEDNQYNTMKLRIKYMYENGNTEFLTALMTSTSITDFLTKSQYISDLSEYDRTKLLAFKAASDLVAEKKAKVEEEYNELAAMEQSQKEKQGQVETLISEQSAMIEALKSEINQNNAQLADLQMKQAQEEARLAAEAAAAEAAEAAAAAAEVSAMSVYYAGEPVYGVAGKSSPVGTGIFCHPCPDYTYITSTFSYRTFDHSFHKGVDFAAPAGTPIYAGEKGTVITSGYSGSAGNWVVINHGNGLVTKYMHCSILYVRTGQHVERGQNIAAVGTTGYSTGNHLHFQVEYRGTPIDPMNYL